MAERKKGAVRTLVTKAMGGGTKAPMPEPAAGARTFTIPKRPVFVLPEGAYDEVEAKAARWHGLKAEIEKLAEEERAKQDKLGKLAEREVREGTSLEATMDKLQDEIAESRKVRERAQLRLEQRGHEERMAIQLHGADFVLVVHRRHHQVLALQQAPVAPVQPEAAAVFFHRLRLAVAHRHASQRQGRAHATPPR